MSLLEEGNRGFRYYDDRSSLINQLNDIDDNISVEDVPQNDMQEEPVYTDSYVPDIDESRINREGMLEMSSEDCLKYEHELVKAAKTSIHYQNLLDYFQALFVNTYYDKHLAGHWLDEEGVSSAADFYSDIYKDEYGFRPRVSAEEDEQTGRLYYPPYPNHQ